MADQNQEFQEDIDLDARIFLAAKNDGPEGLKELVQNTVELNSPIELNNRIDRLATKGYEYRQKVFDRAYEIEKGNKN